MSIRPVDISGMLQRTEDISIIKHNQDQRPAIEQQNLQTQQVRKEEAMRHQVLNPENSTKADTHADAREKGKNSYFYRKKESSKKKEAESEDRVLKKTTGGSFDVKV